MINRSRVVKSALPRYLKGTKSRAVLIIHGYTGYAGEYYELAEKLNKEGYTVSLPRLPGHGTDKKDFLKTGWRDWLNHIQNSYIDLEAQYSSVSIVGLSMGGVLTLILAARYNPERICLLAPAMSIIGKAFKFTPIIGLFFKEIPKKWTPEENDSVDIIKLGKEYWNKIFPGQLANLYKLIRIARKGLTSIVSPTLLMLSAKDTSVSLKTGDILEKGLSNCKIEKVLLNTSHHVLVTGVEKEIVFKNVISWLNQGEKLK